jgi:hypothetical protein
LIHSNYRSEFLCVEFEVYREAMIWRHFDQLRVHLNTLDAAKLERHSAISRAYYEDHHTLERLSEALARIDRGLPQLEPAPVNFVGDPFQDFMDEALTHMQRIRTDETVAVLALGVRRAPRS